MFAADGTQQLEVHAEDKEKKFGFDNRWPTDVCRLQQFRSRKIDQRCSNFIITANMTRDSCVFIDTCFLLFILHYSGRSK